MHAKHWGGIVLLIIVLILVYHFWGAAKVGKKTASSVSTS